MNEFYLEDEVNKILEKRKSNAIILADINKNSALQNKDYLNLENKIGELTIEVAKANIENRDNYEYEKNILECKIEQDKILKNIGLTREMLSPIYECKKCNDSGYIDGKRCSCAKNIINHLLKEKCKMPLKNVSFEDCKDVDEKILKTIKDFCKTYPTKTTYTNLLLAGDTGVGKTYITQAMANYFIKKELYTIFTTATNLVNDFLQFHTTFDENKLSYFQPYIDCDVLIIDDLGTEPMFKNVTKEYLLNLVNERQIHEKLTIITTNLLSNGIIERYGERLFSRLFNSQKCICLQFGDKDLRLKKENI